MDIRKRSKGISLFVLAALVMTILMPAGVAVAASNDASLSDLTVSIYGGSELNLSPAFDADTTTYDVVVPSSTKNVVIKGTPNDPDATVKYNGQSVPPSLGYNRSISGSSTQVNVTVTSSDETTNKVYKITITKYNLLAPTISPKGGTYTSAKTVTIGNINSGSTAYYTLDGTNPTTSGTAEEYTGAFTVSESCTVKAAVYDTVAGWSGITSATFIINDSTEVEKPVIHPSGGTYTTSKSVTISNIDSGSTVYYTTDGTNPTTSGTAEEYTGAFTVSESCTVKAAAYDEEDGWSAVASATFVINDSTTVEKPVIYPDGGTYNDSIRVTISNIESGTTVYYTTDGSDPRDENDAEEYDGAFTVDESLTVKAAAYDDENDEWSAVASEKYVINADEDVNDSDDLAKLKKKFAEAIRKNHMVQAAQILKRIKQLSSQNDVDDRINELKEQIIDAVNDNDWEQAEEILKQLIKLEKSPWAYEQLGDIYEMSGHNGISVFSNGDEVNFDVQPMIINGRTMVPVRKIANALGLSDDKVRWNPNGMVTIDNGSNQIILTKNSKKVKLNGKSYDTDVPAQIVNGRMLVPLRAVSEMFKKNVQWYPNGKIVSIS